MTLIRTFAVVGLSLASSALARTDLAGCTYTDLVVKPTQMAAYASRLWYVPDTGEVCEFLDCGGGRAPPKSTVPGCPLYTGTETYAPSYINPKTLGNGAIEAGSSVAAATTPVLATSSETAAESASASASASESASASATATASATTDASITILTGTNTRTPSKSAESSSAQVTSAASTAGASSSSSGSSSSSSSGAATTTSPSSAAGAMQTVGAVLGPCVVAAIAAGWA
ncbi:hypothetical protein NHJ13051_004280 [Beauveria bassiana]